jgi:hypothetical protein
MEEEEAYLTEGDKGGGRAVFFPWSQYCEKKLEIMITVKVESFLVNQQLLK